MQAPRLKRLGRLLSSMAVVPLLVPGAHSAFADGPSTKAPRSAATASAKPGTARGEGRCRLGFLRKPWDEVLQQVADETGSNLVMPEVPPGKFSRTDFEKHTREHAVRILNRDLEKVGYRLVARADTLEVISTKREKPEYTRPEVRKEAAVPAELPLNAMTPMPARESLTETVNRIQRVNHEAPAAGPKSADVVPAKTSPVVSSTIRPEKRSALDLAKQLHVAFKQRSKLENNGPSGLPAFVVEHFDEAQIAANQPLFVLEIDTANNQLILTAPEHVQPGLKQLISRIDSNPLEEGTPTTLMIGDGKTAEAGSRLSQPLSLIAQARTAPPAAGAASGSVPPEGLNPPDSIPMPPGAGSTPPTAGTAMPLPALLGNLKGDVSIEALNDLDLLILRGNEKDVEAVMQVIREIEKMAIGSVPEIHLLRLQFVDSQSLSQLLNDVYTRMTELRANNAQQSQVSVRVVPVVVPNAVLVLAPTNAIQAVLDLADELDRPIDPSHEVHIFRLKHAISTSVAEMLTSFYTQPPTGLGTRLKVASDARTNSIIVQANPRDLTEITEFIKGVDTEQASSVSQMRLFPLKSATAEELATFLNNAIQGVLNPARMTATQGQGGQVQQGTANQQARATVLEFLRDGGTELVRSGLLNDIRFSADPRTNNLLVTAPEQSMPLVEELIRMLDRPSSAVSEIKIFSLRNADANAAAALLQELFNGTQSQNGNQANQGARALGIELVGTQGSGSNLIPMRFSVDARTNSVVAVGGAEALRIVEAVLYKLDTNDSRNRQTTVIKLRNNSAADVALAINEFLQAQRELATLDPDRISTSQLLEQEIIVTAEPVTNSLLISATPTYFKQLEEIAKRLDAEPPQVVIQAMLVEVTLTNADEFGVELGIQDPVLFARSAITDLVTTTTQTNVPGVGTTQTTNVISQSAVPGFNFNNQPLGNNNRNTATNGIVGGQGLSNFNVGRTSNDLGYGGMVLSASSDSVSVLIRALAARRSVRVLSRPQVIALDNQIAEIQVGQIVPVPDGVVTTGNGLAQTEVIRDPAGIILTVSPRISPEGQIVMEVAAEKSAYPDLSSGVPIFVDSNGQVVTSPVKDITTARTTVKVPDGQTVVVGGMITSSDQTEERKIPWLGDLPIIGKAFRYDAFNNRRTELLIFLTPRIIHNDGDMELIKQVETGRMHFFQDDVEAMHGPIFGNPPNYQMHIETSPALDMMPAEPVQIREIPHAPGVPQAPGTPQIPVIPPPAVTPDLINPTGARSIQDSKTRRASRIND